MTEEVTLETRVALTEQSIKTHEGILNNLTDDVKEIKDKLMGRPTWAVSIIITILTGLCIGLAVNQVKDNSVDAKINKTVGQYFTIEK